MVALTTRPARRTGRDRLADIIAALVADQAALAGGAALWERLGEGVMSAGLRGAVALIDAAGTPRLATIWLPPADRAALTDLLGQPLDGLALPTDGLAARVLTTGRPQTERRLGAAPGWLVAAPAARVGRQIEACLGPAATLAAPLRISGAPAGLMVIWGRGLGLAATRTLASLAGLIGMALDHRALTTAGERAATLAALARTVTAAPDLPATVRALAERLAQALGGDDGALLLLEDQDQTVVGMADTQRDGWRVGVVACFVPGTPVAEALRLREPRLVLAEPGEYDLAALTWERMGARLYLPLLAEGRLVGLAIIHWRAPRGPLSPDERIFTTEMATFGGIAVARALQLTEAARAQARAEAEAALIGAATGGTGLSAVLEAATAALLRGLAADDVIAFGLTDDWSRPLAGSRASVQPWRRLDSAGYFISQTARGVLASGVPTFVAAANADPEYREWLLQHGIVATLIVPLRGHDRPVGLAYVDWQQAAPVLTATDLAFVAGVAGHTALAIERAELLDAQQRQRQRAEALAALARAVNATDDLPAALTTVAEHLRTHLVGDTASIGLLSEDGRWLNLAPGVGTLLYPDRMVLVELFPTVAASLADGQIRLLTEQSAGVSERAVLAQLQCVATLFVPIVHQTRILGAALLGYRRPVAVDADDLALAGLLAEQCAGALARARLLAESEAARRQAARLVQAARMLTASLALPNVLEEIGQAAEALLEMERCFVYLIDEAAGVARSVWLPAALRQRQEPIVIPLDLPGLVPLTIQRRAPVLAGDALTSTEINPALVGRFGTRAAIAAPLLARETVIGALVVADTRGPRQFSPADVAAVQALAALAAAAIENARLYAGERARGEELAALNHRLRESQAQLVQAGKLAAVGTLAAGVAHELNQPLTVIRGLAQLLLPAHQHDEHLASRLARIERQTDKMTQVINHLRAFGRPSSGTAAPVPLNHVVAQALLLIGQRLREQTIGLERALADPTPVAWAESIEIEQVLLNLLSNAADALTERGGPGTIVVRTWSDPTGCHLAVTDDGPGIAIEVLPRLFDPFFTTKDVGKGTGLGLSISRQIAHHWGGDLTVASIPGAGATFTLTLPSAQ